MLTKNELRGTFADSEELFHALNIAISSLVELVCLVTKELSGLQLFLKIDEMYIGKKDTSILWYIYAGSNQFMSV